MCILIRILGYLDILLVYDLLIVIIHISILILRYSYTRYIMYILLLETVIHEPRHASLITSANHESTQGHME